jgi:hypothetical protein
MVWIFRKALSLPAVAQVVSCACAAEQVSSPATNEAKNNFMNGLRRFGRIIQAGNRGQGSGVRGHGPVNATRGDWVSILRNGIARTSISRLF